MAALGCVVLGVGVVPAFAVDVPVDSLDPSVESAPSVLAAAVEAAAIDEPVLVESLVSESAAVFVQPDGSRTLEVFSAPVRVADRDGAGWVPVDLSLADAGAVVAPAASPLAVVLSDGGLDGMVARVPVGSGSVEVVWSGPTAIPVPVLEGSRATYADVFPGVDLVVDLRESGIKLGFVVRERPAASLALPLRVRGVGGVVVREAVGTPGGLEFVDGSGVVGLSEPPVMFDSSPDDPFTGDPPHRVAVAASVAATVDGVVQTLAPDPGFFDRAGLVYPVVVDPSVETAWSAIDTFLDSASPSTSQNGTGVRSGKNTLNNINRGLIRFDLADASYPAGTMGDAQGMDVTSATLRLTQFFASSGCVDPGRTHRVYRATSTWNEAITWNGATTYDTDEYAGDLVGCGNGVKAFTVDSSGAGTHTNLAQLVQLWALNDIGGLGVANQGLLVRAADESFTDSRRHFRDDEYAATDPTQIPKLDITYDPVAGSATINPTSGHGNGVWSTNPNFAATFAPSGITAASWDVKWDGVVTNQGSASISKPGLLRPRRDGRRSDSGLEGRVPERRRRSWR